jgi:glycerol transport system permease protein
MRPTRLIVPLYLLLSLVPIYWLVGMSLKTNEEILGGFSLFPHAPTLANYLTIFTDPDWNQGYLNSLTYVAINTVLSVVLALPAAYAFSRYRFLACRPFTSPTTPTAVTSEPEWRCL